MGAFEDGIKQLKKDGLKKEVEMLEKTRKVYAAMEPAYLELLPILGPTDGGRLELLKASMKVVHTATKK